ncbi:DUF302 domain-containing protein [Synechococcus elongatus]|uniref:DUF302 domain-containing protein n=1 Tax=Synechococcus elongatus PCC 11801 TaxID=2219813 RepID=A0AAN1QPZ7_SYNEL|nr:DUF302 domain-containing protein [Synechococcus elongatus]AZB73320.1 DUF302 domain-containing protein [Synechococcus elongatus PCC 11801]
MYHLSKVLQLPFDDALSHTKEVLKQHGFGVLTEIDAQAAFKQKLDVEFRHYTILGACHPRIAYSILQAEDKAGVFYPCNVVVQEHENGCVEVSAIDPAVMFAALENPETRAIALEAKTLMEQAIAQL